MNWSYILFNRIPARMPELRIVSFRNTGRLYFFILMVLVCFGFRPSGTQAQNSLYADPKARDAGDILTVVLVERTNAQRESGWENKSNAGVDGNASVSGRGDLNGQFALDANFNREALNRNGSVQSDLLHGTITVSVVDVDSSGNIVIQGERRLNVNGETHIMKIAGRVRPFDVRYDNTVLSYQIANANIEYRRAGLGRKFLKPGTMVRFGVLALIGAATYFAVEK